MLCSRLEKNSRWCSDEVTSRPIYCYWRRAICGIACLVISLLASILVAPDLCHKPIMFCRSNRVTRSWTKPGLRKTSVSRMVHSICAIQHRKAGAEGNVSLPQDSCGCATTLYFLRCEVCSTMRSDYSVPSPFQNLGKCRRNTGGTP